LGENDGSGDEGRAAGGNPKATGDCIGHLLRLDRPIPGECNGVLATVVREHNVVEGHPHNVIRTR
jgi:hypothetical protein